MTKLFDCGECATGCYGRCMRAIVKEMDERNKAIVAWGQPDAAGNIVETISPYEKEGDMKEWAAQYKIPLVKQPDPMYLLGEMREGGVVWFNQNPHAHPVGTKFYADKEATK